MIKKLLTLLVLCTAASVNAQDIYIPDANFKAKLISLGIDTSGDGEIQELEASSVLDLDLFDSQISDLTGIQSFKNLITLYCSNNKLTSLDVTPLVNLEGLYCSDNQLTSLDVKPLVNLRGLNCNRNQLTTLDIAPLMNLQSLECGSNQLTSLDVTPLVNLTHLICPYNKLTSLDVTPLVNLIVLYCVGNQLTSLDFTHLVNLIDLYCSDNQLTSLDFSPLVNLKTLWCGGKQLTSLDFTPLVNLTTLSCPDSSQIASLDFTPLVNLEQLNCYNNQLTSLDVTPLVNLKHLSCYSNKLTTLDLANNAFLEGLDCSNNQLTTLDVTPLMNLTILVCNDNELASLDVTPLVNLKHLSCYSNQLTTLDVTPSVNLIELSCNDNQLETLFMKNNSRDILKLENNPNLQYICADELEIAYVQNKLTNAGMTNTVVNSYCSFTPGGNYNTVTGTGRFDVDNNGCDANDAVFTNLKITITDGVTTSALFENSLGVYKTFIQKNNITLTPSFENPTYFNVTPTEKIYTFSTIDNSTHTQDFCVTTNGVHNDVEVVIIPASIVRPGEDVVYKIVYKNKGNQTLSGDVKMVYDDNLVDFISASNTPSVQSSANLTWSYSNLKPFETRSFTVTYNVNSPQEDPAVNDGDILNYTVTINPVAGDELPDDNLFEFHQTVVNSLDPNDIICLQGSMVSPEAIGEYLHYTINFENIGTASAINIVVKDIINTAKFDLSTLQVLSASHDMMNTTITGNKVEFVFEGINLGTKEHGSVVFKIKTLNTLQTGDSVLNNADIFFDYNFPVATNDEVTTFQALNNRNFIKDISIQISPNPASSFVYFNADSAIKSIETYDIQGRIVNVKLVNDFQTRLDISSYTNGVYFFKVETEKGISIEKLIKE